MTIMPKEFDGRLEKKRLIREIEKFYWETIFKFFRMGLTTQGKTMDDIVRDERSIFWKEKNVHCRQFGKKLNQLLK